MSNTTQPTQRRGGVSARNYVLHRRFGLFTRCGRIASEVNCASEPVKDHEREGICLKCGQSKKGAS